MAAIPPVCDFDWVAPDFSLPGVDERKFSLRTVKGSNGTLIMFICNHCPYVLAVLDRILRDCNDLISAGIGVAAISSNDVEAYPEDSFLNMRKLSEENKFPFPYLYDEDQSVARSYNAICTPDFFGFTPWWRNLFENDGFVQFVHRVSAYLLVIYVIVVALKVRSSSNKRIRSAFLLFGLLIFLQLLLGIITVMNSSPWELAILHQFTAIILWLSVIRVRLLTGFPIATSVRN